MGIASADGPCDILHPMRASSSLLWSSLMVACVACSGSAGGVDEPDASPFDAPPPADCVRDGCTDWETCNPFNHACEPIPCAHHTDCPDGTFCGPGGVCANSNTGGPCTNNDNCTGGEVCVGGSCACEGQQFQAEGVPPNVVIVLDRSGSMDEIISGSQTKWDIAVQAVANLMASHGAQVRFGLELFATDDNCAVNQVNVAPGPGTGAQINSTLAASQPFSLTPIGGALQNLVSYAGIHDPNRENYVLLLTDGFESCGGDPLTAVNALRAGSPDIKTFVVGFGSGVDTTTLSAMAQAGGTAQPTTPAYFQADNAASLGMAFDTIGAAVLSCTYTLTGSPDEASMFVRFDGTEILRDMTHTNGWDYDPVTHQIVFFGMACTDLRSGTVQNLVIGSGCGVG